MKNKSIVAVLVVVIITIMVCFVAITTIEHNIAKQKEKDRMQNNINIATKYYNENIDKVKFHKNETVVYCDLDNKLRLGYPIFPRDKNGGLTDVYHIDSITGKEFSHGDYYKWKYSP